MLVLIISKMKSERILFNKTQHVTKLTQLIIRNNNNVQLN